MFFFINIYLIWKFEIDTVTCEFLFIYDVYKYLKRINKQYYCYYIIFNYIQLGILSRIIIICSS